MNKMMSISAIILENNRVEIRERHADTSLPDTVITIPISFASTIVHQLNELLGHARDGGE